MSVFVEISIGELVDKLTILEIKLDHIADPAKREHVVREYESLSAEATRAGVSADARRDELKAVNQELWRVEDDLRACERAQTFGDAFVALARSVYVLNDRRAAIKSAINQATGSRLREEKSYESY